MNTKNKPIEILTGSNASPDDERVLELQRLIACYQLSTPDDKNVVWAVLNKYAPKLN